MKGAFSRHCCVSRSPDDTSSGDTMYYCVMCCREEAPPQAPAWTDEAGMAAVVAQPLNSRYSTVQSTVQYSTVQYSNAPQLQGQSQLPGRGEAAAQRALDQGRDPHRGGGHQVPRQHLQGEPYWVAFILYLVPTQGSSFIS